jgi:uroporphyrinogen-III synthase
MTDTSKPLSDTRVLVGRARHQANKLAAALRELGAEVIEIPFIEIRPPRSYQPLDSALKRIGEYEWIILTSVNGVDAIASRLRQLRIKTDGLSSMKVAAIGPATRDAAEKLGLRVTIVPPRYVAESVVESLHDQVEGKRVLVARAKVARDVIPRELRNLGATVDVVEAYEAVVPTSSQRKLRALMNDPKRRPDIITFTSSSTVRNFMRLQGLRERPFRTELEGIRFASIGPVTSATMRELGLPVDMEAREFTTTGLVQAILGN